jgi:hypothetical protein
MVRGLSFKSFIKEGEIFDNAMTTHASSIPHNINFYKKAVSKPTEFWNKLKTLFQNCNGFKREIGPDFETRV